MDAWSIFIFIVFVASIPVATEMARERERSRRFWFWIAFFVGPLAPVVLLVFANSPAAKKKPSRRGAALRVLSHEAEFFWLPTGSSRQRGTDDRPNPLPARFKSFIKQ